MISDITETGILKIIDRIIFHIDMDAFFASCEEAINPELKGKPLIVGGTKDSRRGIVSCPNYLARAKGIKTAMPLVKALQLAPEGNFINGTRGLYSDFSKRVMNILYKYSPDIEQASIDEAYIDVTGVLHIYKGDYKKLAESIKDEIKKSLGITCSIGISSGKVFSKIASKYNKPDGITTIEPGKEKEFLAELPVERIPGVGKSTLKNLQKYNIRKIADLLKYDRSFYINEIGNFSEHLLDVANGIDNHRIHTEHENQKSLSKENTFYFDTNSIPFLKKELYTLLERALNRLRKKSLEAKTFTIKVKYFDLTVNQRSITRIKYSNLESDYFEDALKLLTELLKNKKKIRLLGVRFSELKKCEGNFQENIFIDNDKFKAITEKMDKIRSKYNFDIIKFGKNF